MVEFAEFTKDEQEIVDAIVERSVRMFIHDDSLDALMDISATHIHTPLRLNDLLNADDFNFVHDLAGIRRHLDRTTGQLMHCFSPRHSA